MIGEGVEVIGLAQPFLPEIDEAQTLADPCQPVDQADAYRRPAIFSDVRVDE
ncbi:hypothetical protein D3C83_315290 [compost metagenome]